MKKSTIEIISTILKNEDGIRPDVIDKVLFSLTGKNEPIRQKYFNLKEISIKYGISRATAYEWIRKGNLKPIIINLTKRYEFKPLEELQTAKERC